MTGSVCVFRAVDSAALASSSCTDRVECGDVVDGRTAPQAQRKAMMIVDRVAGEGEDGTGETRAGKTPARAGASDWAGIATTAEGASHIGEEVGVEAALEEPAEDVIEIESNSEAWEVDSAGDKGDQEGDALEMKSATEVEAVDPRGWIPREFRDALEQLDQPEEQDKEEEQGAPSEVVAPWGASSLGVMILDEDVCWWACLEQAARPLQHAKLGPLNVNLDGNDPVFATDQGAGDVSVEDFFLNFTGQIKSTFNTYMIRKIN